VFPHSSIPLIPVSESKEFFFIDLSKKHSSKETMIEVTKKDVLEVLPFKASKKIDVNFYTSKTAPKS